MTRIQASRVAVWELEHPLEKSASQVTGGLHYCRLTIPTGPTLASEAQLCLKGKTAAALQPFRAVGRDDLIAGVYVFCWAECEVMVLAGGTFASGSTT